MSLENLVDRQLFTVQGLLLMSVGNLIESQLFRGCYECL
jgi:hypothetical protein